MQGQSGLLNVMTIPPGAGLGQRIVIDGFRGAIFEYDPNNNLVASWASAAGTDPYGNPYPAGLTISSQSAGIFFYSGQPGLGTLFFSLSPIAGTDAFGNTFPAGVQVGPPGSNQLVLAPNIGSAVNVTQAFTGTLGGGIQLFTSDVNEVLSGFLGSALLGTGATAKMATVLSSPFDAEGCAIILASQNDGATDVPYILLGTTTTPDASTLVFQPIVSISPFAVLFYGAGGTISVVTHTSGSGTFPIPVGVTSVKAESWGPAGSSGSSGVGGGGGGGAGAGGYGQEPNLTVPSGGTAAYVVGAAGSGTASTIAGSTVTVTGNAGTNATNGVGGNGGTRGNGGAASANTVAFAGGRGGNGGAGGGGGGGGSASASGAGNHGNVGSPTAGGLGGGALPGGGGGGTGGASTGQAGFPGGTPGGAGGGGGGTAAITFPAGSGKAGQVRITYNNGAPPIMVSFAKAAGTDLFGTAYPAGTILNGPDSNQYNAGPNIVVLTAAVSINSTTGVTILSHAVGIGTYDIEVWLVVQNATVNDPAQYVFSGPAAAATPQLIDFQFTPAGASQSVNYGASATYTSAFNGANPVGNQRVHIKATVKFTAAGTLTLTGKETVAGNTIAVSAGGSMKLTPVVAT